MPGRMSCGCAEASPVLVVENLRLFMFGTTGYCYGVDHALTKGLLACLVAQNAEGAGAESSGAEVHGGTRKPVGSGFQWILPAGVGVEGDLGPDAYCDKCGEVTGMPVAVAIDRETKTITTDGSLANHYNKVMCQGCFLEWSAGSV